MNIGIIGTGARSTDYLKLLLDHPDFQSHRVTALCDCDEGRLEAYAGFFFGETGPALYTDYRRLLADAEVQAVLITTPDGAHLEIALAAMEAGKHILLEKPMECSAARALALYEKGRTYTKTLMMGFVLRYAAVYERVQSLLRDGAVGDIVTVQAAEKLGYRHAASFMRRWHRFTENSGGMMNTKCCHDMDILRVLIGSDAAAVYAEGDRRFFVPKEGAAAHCRDCALRETCVYAFDYTGYGSPTRFSCEEDLCVYNSGKDVVDNESLLIRYENGVVAQFELCLFSGEPTRKLTIHGTKATLEADFRRSRIRLLPLGPGDELTIDLQEPLSGHGGGDAALLRAFTASCAGTAAPVNQAADGLKATLTALAGDVSRRERRPVTLRDMGL